MLHGLCNLHCLSATEITLEVCGSFLFLSVIIAVHVLEEVVDGIGSLRTTLQNDINEKVPSQITDTYNLWPL
jgi:hypothetical protein